MTGPARGNRVRRALDGGEIAVVVAGHSATSDTADFVGQLGFDGLWLEGEHGAVTWDRIGDLSRACELWDMAAMYRVRTLEPSLVARALTLGVHGIVVPQVSTADEARRLVAAAKFAPQGARGVSRGRRSYGRPGFLDKENDETVLVVQLEDPDALRNAEEIAAVPGIDVVFVAPNDLAQAMGHQGRPDHPEVADAIDETLTRIAAAGTAPGTLCPADQIDRFTGLGARFLYTSYDAWITAGARDFRRALDAATARRDPRQGTARQDGAA
ncbi:aldolase/citrate lyase family protein [Actinomadura sp. NPDC048394]|jgi:4-hydroxy-2-oxoheptanedioate aldolase|uniref:HpcH/HpaI aldolase family protein n=1 Tax=Actinomadura sp. NPDC048394 TaxID=3158223 RepID=UPI0033C8FC62